MAISSDKVAFVATYRDGGEEWFAIDTSALSGGDHVAEAVAKERQGLKLLPAGEIVGVKRMVAVI